jgi:hypothetical protein
VVGSARFEFRRDAYVDSDDDDAFRR